MFYWLKRLINRTRLLRKNSYQCAYCEGVFIRGRSDEEAYLEYQNNFGFAPIISECDIICDDCYKKYFGVGL